MVDEPVPPLAERAAGQAAAAAVGPLVAMGAVSDDLQLAHDLVGRGAGRLRRRRRRGGLGRDAAGREVHDGPQLDGMALGGTPAEMAVAW